MTTSPTFVAKFSDGVVTKMTCRCKPGSLDLRRGIVLARLAYRSRTKGKEPPSIVVAFFQEPFKPDGKVLREYDEKEIADEGGWRDDNRKLNRTRTGGTGLSMWTAWASVALKARKKRSVL